MEKENRSALRGALAELIRSAKQADSILLQSEINDGFRMARGLGDDTALDAATMADVDTAKTEVVGAFNAASAIFTATEPV